MNPCFTFDETRRIESKIIAEENVPSIVLMENAGKNSCDALFKLIPKFKEKSIYILCGKGNNAGDGFTLARHLLIRKISPTIVNIISPSLLKGDALINFELIKKCKGDFIEYDEFLRICSTEFKKRKDIIIVDAILGTGIKGKLDEIFSGVINFLNDLKKKNKKITIISLDVPSGLTSGEQINPVVFADHTISMGTAKIELLYGSGHECSGEIKVVPIGITRSLLDRFNSFGKYVIEFDDVKNLFPNRKKVSHKYANGKVLIIGGSAGLSGAVAMSSVSALRSGAGAVAAAIPKSIMPVFKRKMFEVMSIELDETSDGTIAKDQFEKIRNRIDWADVILLGPGISTNEETREFEFDVIKYCDKPMVIDADGLNNLSFDLSILKSRKNDQNILLTPHLGEFSKLTAIEIKDIIYNRFELIKKFSEEYKVDISLKSETTVSYLNSNPELNGKFFLNSSGNESLASAGTGDILSGIIASIYAQTKDAYKALICGNYLHGYCADLYYQETGNNQSATPQDIIKMIPKAITGITNYEL